MEDNEQFCLQWNNHQSTLISVFNTLLEKEVHVDCTLAAEGQTMKAHKVILSACSPYFETILNQHYDKHPIILLKDVKFVEMKAIIDYMYRGEVNISKHQLSDLLKVAESLQIKGLSDFYSKPPAPTATKQPRSIRTSLSSEKNLSREGSISSTRRKRRKLRSSASASPSPLTREHSDENNFTPDIENTVLELKTEDIDASNVELKSEFMYNENESDEDLSMEKVDSETELTSPGTDHILPYHDASRLAQSTEENSRDVDETLEIETANSPTASKKSPMDFDKFVDDKKTQKKTKIGDSKSIILQSMALKFEQTEPKGLKGPKGPNPFVKLMYPSKTLKI